MKPLLWFNPAHDGHLIADEIYFYTMMDDRLNQHYSNATVWIISTPPVFKIHRPAASPKDSHPEWLAGV